MRESNKTPNHCVSQPPRFTRIDLWVARNLQFALRCRKAASGWDDEMLESRDSFAIESVPGDCSYHPSIFRQSIYCIYSELFPNMTVGEIQKNAQFVCMVQLWKWSFSTMLQIETNGLIIICSLLNHLSFDIMQDLEIHWSEIDRLKCQTPANEVDDRPKRRLAFYENRLKSMHSLIAMTHWQLDILVLKTLWRMYLSLSTRGAKQNIQKRWRKLVEAIFSHWTWVDGKMLMTTSEKTHCQSDVFECLWYFIFGVSLIFKDIPWPSHVRRPGSSESTGVLLPNLANDDFVAVGLWAENSMQQKGFSPNSTNDEAVVQNENLGTPQPALIHLFIGGIKMTEWLWLKNEW